MSSDESIEYDIEEDIQVDESSFQIGEIIIEKNDLIRMVKSNAKEQLNALVSRLITLKECNTVSSKTLNVMKYLLENGYNLDILNSTGQTAVHLAFYECFKVSDKNQDDPGSDINNEVKCFECSKLLETLIDNLTVNKSCALNYTDSYGLTYLHIACYMGNIDLVIKCLNADVNVDTSFCHVHNFFKNCTALHFAAIGISGCAAEIVDLLLEHGANVEAKDCCGRIPLHLAFKNFHNWGLLYPNNVDCSAKNSIENPQHFHSINLKIIRVLLKKCNNVDVADIFDNTLLLSILQDTCDEFPKFIRSNSYNHSSQRASIQEITVKFAILIQKGADLNVKDNNNNTVLHLILKNMQHRCSSITFQDNRVLSYDAYYVKMIEKVLKCNKEFNINSKNAYGETPLQLAVQNISYDIVKLLLEQNADMNCLKCHPFYYPNVAPNFKCIRNVINIISLFENEGYILSFNAYLEVMKFLVHDREDCECKVYDDAVYFGSKNHLLKCFNQIVNYDELLLRNSNEQLLNLDMHYRHLKNSGFSFDNELFEFFARLNVTCDQRIRIIRLNFLYHEFDGSKGKGKVIKSTKLDDNITLFDVIKKHYRHIPRNVLDSFDEKILAGCGVYGKLIKGHFAKAFLRRFIEKYADIPLKTLYPALPDLCCRLLVQYLDNEDILNLSLAVLTEDPNEIRLLVK